MQNNISAGEANSDSLNSTPVAIAAGPMEIQKPEEILADDFDTSTAPVFHVDDWPRATTGEVLERARILERSNQLEWPNRGQPFTIRIKLDTVVQSLVDAGNDEFRGIWEQINEIGGRSEAFYEFHVVPQSGDGKIRGDGPNTMGLEFSRVFRGRREGVPVEKSEETLDFFQQWHIGAVLERWRDGDWFCYRAAVSDRLDRLWREDDARIPRVMIFRLGILLHDPRVILGKRSADLETLHEVIQVRLGPGGAPS
jgi:hypothetical protein